MYEKLLQLMKRVESLMEPYDHRCAADILCQFENISANSFDSLYKLSRSKSWHTERQTWLRTLQDIDRSVGADTQPERPWTRVFFRRFMPEHDFSAIACRDDLRVFGSRPRNEIEMDAILATYFKHYEGLRIVCEIGDLYCEAPTFEDINGRVVSGINVYPTQVNEDTEPNWDVIADIEDISAQIMDTIIRETQNIASEQCQMACEHQLLALLFTLEKVDRLWNLFTNDRSATKRNSSTSFRARLAACLHASLSSISEIELETTKGLLPQNKTLELSDDLLILLTWHFQTKRILSEGLDILHSFLQHYRDLYQLRLGSDVGFVSEYLEELRIALLSILFIQDPLGLQNLESNTLHKDEELDLLRKAEDVFSFLVEMSGEDSFVAFRIDGPIPFRLRNELFEQSTELVRRSMRSIGNVEEFRQFLDSPNGFLEYSENRGAGADQLFRQEMGLPPEADFKDVIVDLNNKLHSSDSRYEQFEVLLDQLKTPPNLVGDAHTRLINVERRMRELILDCYRNKGESSDQRMFADLFSAIKAEKHQKREARGTLDGPVGTGKLFLTDHKHLIRKNWGTYFKPLFKGGTSLKSITKLLAKLEPLRNRDAHPQDTREEQEKNAYHIMTYLDELEVLCEDPSTLHEVGE